MSDSALRIAISGKKVIPVPALTIKLVQMLLDQKMVKVGITLAGRD